MFHVRNVSVCVFLCMFEIIMTLLCCGSSACINGPKEIRYKCALLLYFMKINV